MSKGARNGDILKLTGFRGFLDFSQKWEQEGSLSLTIMLFTYRLGNLVVAIWFFRIDSPIYAKDVRDYPK